MKICLMHNLYKPYNRGGAERIVELIFEGLEKENHETFVITTKPKFSKLNPQNPKIYYINSLFYYLNKIPIFLRPFWHFYDMFNFVNYFKIKKILKKEKPNIIITHNLKGLGYLTPKAIKNLNIKHIHILHDIQLLHPSGLMLYGREKKNNGIFAKIYAHICNILFNSPAVIMSPSKWLMDLCLNKKFFKNSKKIILPNPAPETKKENAKKNNKVFRFLYAGQIEKHKGIFVLINAFSEFKKNTNIQCELVVAGEGTELKNAKSQTKQTNCSRYIKFLGQRNKNNIAELMQSSNCLLIPSLCYENSPSVIYEAATFGLPIIASKIGGITEIIHFLGGILFEPNDKKNLIKKINWAINNQKEIKKIGEKSKEKIKKMQLKNYIKKLLIIINDCY